MVTFLEEKDFYLFTGKVSKLDKFLELYEACEITLLECQKYDCDISGNSDLYFVNVPRLYEACISLGYEAFIDAENGVMAVLDTSKLANEADIKNDITNMVVELVRRHHPRKRKWSVWSNHKLSDGKRRKYGTHKSKTAALKHDKMSKLGGG